MDRRGQPDDEQDQVDQAAQAAPHPRHLDGHLDGHLDPHGDPDRHLHGARGAIDDEHHDPLEHRDQQPHDHHGPRAGGWPRR